MSRPKKISRDTISSDPTVRLSYKYRAYPTDLQQYRLENWFYVLQGLYNTAIDERRNAYKTEGRSVTYTEQQNALPKLKQEDALLSIVHSQVLQDCLQRVDKAYQKFFDDLKRKKAGQKIRVGYPRMKKLSGYCSITFPQVWMKNKDKLTEAVKLRCDADSRFACLLLPGIGKLKILLHRSIPWNTAKSVTIKRTRSGAWYVCISVEMAIESKLKDNGTTTGIDLGVANLIATSDKNYVDHPKFLRKSELKVKQAQHKLSRKAKGSNNRNKSRLTLAKLHEKIANQRKDFLHKLSLWIVLNYANIAFENLNISGMVRNPHLAKSILDAGWGNLIQYTAYKSVMLRGNNVVRVNPAYSSQDCSACGFRVPKTLADRIHSCPNCGVLLERDHNAANVLELRAFGSNTVGAGTAPNRQAMPANACGDETSTLGFAQCKSRHLKQEAPTESVSVSRG